MNKPFHQASKQSSDDEEASEQSSDKEEDHWFRDVRMKSQISEADSDEESSEEEANTNM